MNTIVIAPHPDDELLGVGGTILRKKDDGVKVAWVIVTSITSENGWSEDIVEKRASEIKQANKFFGFDSVFELNFPTSFLDRTPVKDLVSAFSKVFKTFKPQEVFLPYPGDVHTDHRMVFDAAVGAAKWFRCPTVRRILAYETLSETEFGLDPRGSFSPNVFINIEDQLQKKLEATEIYKSEFSDFPFPRSKEAMASLARFRGSSAGFKAAEAFQLLREIL